MPPKGRPRERLRKLKDSVIKEFVEKSEATPKTSHRPRTRAWARLEEQRQTEPSSPPVTSQFALKHSEPSRKSKKKTKQIEEGTQPLQISNEHQTTNSAAVHDHGRRRSKRLQHIEPSASPVKESLVLDHAAGKTFRDLSVERRQSAGSKNLELSAWINEVEVPSPPDSQQPHISGTMRRNIRLDQADPSLDQSSSSTSRVGDAVPEGDSTLKAEGRRKGTALTWEKLKHRFIGQEPVEVDIAGQRYHTLLHTESLQIPFKNIEKLLSIMGDFKTRAEQNPEEDAYPYIDRITDEIDQWKSEVSMPTTTVKRFSTDVARCLVSNEAVLQRTIMMSVIDRSELQEIFEFNCEGQWSMTKERQLYSLQDDSVPAPKPDLAMFFKMKSLTANPYTVIPSDLRDCLRPDSPVGKECQRCFPFLFMEVKKADKELEDALRANVWSASLALFNIYNWMESANQVDSFFKDVRVYSLVFNAQDLYVRVHRARKLNQPNYKTDLEFVFSEHMAFRGYSKDQACLLLRKILIEYASKTLHGILKKVFQTVTMQEYNNIQNKRKGLEGSKPSKRSRRTDPETSFGTSSLNIS